MDAGGHGIIERGEATTLFWLNDEQITVLKDRGRISEISAPPLSEMPLSGATLRSFKKAKLDDANEVLALTTGELAKKLGVRKATAQKRQLEVARLLMVEPPRQG